jgi:large subunit ribosomal protein L24
MIQSKQPRKKRKFFYKAPLHIARKFVSAHVSKELREKLKKRSLVLKKGFVVKISRGTRKGLSAKVVKVDLGRKRIFIEGVVKKKQGGKEVLIPFDSSNLIIVST